jgi:hypothetical protein
VGQAPKNFQARGNRAVAQRTEQWHNPRVHLKLCPCLLLAALNAACATGPVAPAPGHAQQASATTNAQAVQAAIQCPNDPDIELTYRVDCRASADCSVAWASVDCCGTARALGAAKAAEPQLTGQLAQCPGRASCECLAGPTLLDSGERASGGPEDIALECQRGRCVTRLRDGAPPPEGRASGEPL